MADDTTQSPDMDAALGVCRDALRRTLTGETGLESLFEPLQNLSSCARREQVPPERVLVSVKQLLQDAGAFDRLPPQQRDTMRGRLIQTVIAAYFADESRETGGGRREEAEGRGTRGEGRATGREPRDAGGTTPPPPA